MTDAPTPLPHPDEQQPPATEQQAPAPTPEAPPALPTLVRVNASFSARMPTQRVLDAITRQEGVDFTELATNQPFRIVAFRALLRDFPTYDITALWMHAYDVEVEVENMSPLNGKSMMHALGSADSGG